MRAWLKPSGRPAPSSNMCCQTLPNTSAPILMHFVINAINIRILAKQGQAAAQGLSSGA